MLEKKQLNGTLISLIPMIKDDFEGLYVAANDPLIWEQHPDPLRYTPYGFTKFFKKLLSTEIPYVIIDRQTRQIIGASTFYDSDPKNRTVVIGYTFLSKEYWGGLYNHEIKSLMLSHAFQKADRVLFHVGSDNERSKRALEKIGATPVDPVHPSQKAERLTYSIVPDSFLKH